MAPTTQPVVKPNLPQGGILWRSAQSDQFDNETLSLNWHFLSKHAASRYSLSDRKGWVRLSPDTARVHLVQKETDHYYSAVTRVDLDATEATAKAGIYLTNGNQKVFVQLYSGFDGGKKIVFKFDTTTRSVPNTIGNVLWLKVTRYEHQLTGYYSGDGKTWTAVGAPISAVSLDKVQPNYNSWVGTSVGLFAEGKPADFDFFVCKDGFSSLPRWATAITTASRKQEKPLDKPLRMIPIRVAGLCCRVWIWAAEKRSPNRFRYSCRRQARVIWKSGSTT